VKISVFVDGANIFYMQKDELKWWINFEKLLRWIENKTGGEIIDAYYYVGEENPPDTRQQGFLTALADIGYSIITKELKIIVLDDGREIREGEPRHRDRPGHVQHHRELRHGDPGQQATATSSGPCASSGPGGRGSSSCPRGGSSQGS